MKLTSSLIMPIARRPIIYSSSLAAATANAQAAAAADTQSPGSPFYWEIGNKTGKLASGIMGDGSIDNTTAMNIASASKWLVGAYAAQHHTLTSTDYPFLTMTSGYKNMGGQCTAGGSQTVDGCLATGTYNVHSPAYDGVFFYNSGHFEHYASASLGLGTYHATINAPTLRTAFDTMFGLAGVAGASSVQWTQPMLAGGAFTAADTYTAILRKILDGTLAIGALLGTQQVPASALLGAANSPAPVDEAWYYSLGHWVEPDGTFSSGGSLGFYPWISADKRYYGVVVRNNLTGSDTGTIGIESVRTGQAIRAAFFNH